jgi:hypothetical protein
MTKLGYLNSFPKDVFESEEVRMDPGFRRAHYQLKNQSRAFPPPPHNALNTEKPTPHPIGW